MLKKTSRITRYGKVIVFGPLILLGLFAMVFTYLASGKIPTPKYYRKREGVGF